jgi:carboxypeptidase Q
MAALVSLAGCHLPNGGALDRLVIGEVMLHSELAENLRALAQPGGRLSGSPNGHRAEQFLAEKLQQYGLRNVHFEPFEMTAWQVDQTVVVCLGDPPETLEGAVALGNSQSTPAAGITAQLSDAGEGKEEDFARLGDALRGKFALVRDDHGRRADKLRLALDHGAAGLLVAAGPNHEPVIGMGHPAPRPEPGIAIRHDDGEKLASRLAAGETLHLNVKVRADIWDARPNNVVAEIPGHGLLAHQVVILGAHLDSWHLAEGAIDNGNGSAAVLETARALAASGWKPRRTVRFIWFMGEEQNLGGSRAYVAAHADTLRDVLAMVNVDMPGSPRRFSTSGPPAMIQFLRSLRTQLRAYELGDEISKLAPGFSDHGPFLEAGVSTIALWGDLGPGVASYHTTGDKYEVVDRRATVQSAAVLGVLVRQLADYPTRLDGQATE